MRVLFIGGTGVISSACSDLCLEKGMDLYLLNRGQSFRPNPKGATVLNGDIRNTRQIKSLIRDLSFDVVVNWIAYETDHVKQDVEIFRHKTSQYIFISSASVYQKPPSRLPVQETEPIVNPHWPYSQKKIACEKYLIEEYNSTQFPVTIVRPSHTYDRTKIPLYGGYTTINRTLKGKKIVVQGDGTAVWTLTHNTDFAKGFIGLLGHEGAIGEAYHITSDELLTWNEIYQIMAEAAGVQANIVHIPTDFLWHCDRLWGDSFYGDKMHSLIFDNSKIKTINPDYKAVISFRQGAKDIVDWYLADQTRQEVDDTMNGVMDDVIRRYEQIFQD